MERWRQLPSQGPLPPAVQHPPASERHAEGFPITNVNHHSKLPSFEGGREPINTGWSADVRFEAHYGLKPDTAPCPKSATSGLMHCSNEGLFDHLVSAGKHTGQDSQAYGFGGFQIDDEFKLSWLFYGRIGRVRAFQYLIDVGGCPAKQIGGICTIGHKCASFCNLAHPADCWDAIGYR